MQFANIISTAAARIKTFASDFAADDQGVTMIEYGLLAALIAVVCIGAIQGVGTNLQTVFTKIQTTLSAVVN